MPERPLFISFEGGEGAGKTTQIKLLKSFIEECGYTVCLTREPGGTPEAEKIRNLLVQRDGGDWTAEAEVMLLYAARHMHVEKLIKPHLEKGDIVITDRFADSTRAYQSYGHGLPLEFVNDIHARVLGDFEPDITFLLDISVQEGLARSLSHLSQSSGSEKSEDRFEKLDISFHEKLRQGFLELANAHPNRFAVIDATQDIETIQSTLQEKVREALNG